MVQDLDLETLRHDAAHILAQAVKELYPQTQVAIGPTIDNGFYYDFLPQTPFSVEDVERIEARMREIVRRNDPIVREEWSRAQAVSFFEKTGESFKVELVGSIPEDEILTVYRQGDFLDLCRGPHAASTGALGQAFKLTKVAGAYWRGDSTKPMLQRIYGTAWGSQEDLEAYLVRLEEAEKRDHRRLGREMNLFHLQEEAQGSVFWHPKGWTLYRTLQDYLRQKVQAQGYVEINTPQLVSRKLWEMSGHWDKFSEAMIGCSLDETPMALKPMNCPCHVMVFNQGLKSYRDLPLRLAEFGSCLRYEPSGSLLGLMRVRAFVQDDAHIFCTPDQILEETKAFCELLHTVYREMGFDDITVLFSDRPRVRAGTDAVWDKAEASLRAGAEAAGLTYTLNPGEGAFYGPKLEFVLKDALGRRWQCGTLQVDFVLPERLGATYIGPDGAKHHPAMLHRAILGSFERFIGVLLEHYGGRLPLWMAPVQAVVLPITNGWDAYATHVAQALTDAGLRVETDLRNEKVGYKIRELSAQKIPVLCVVGEKEAALGTVSVRRLGSQTQHTLPLEDVVAGLAAENHPLSRTSVGVD